MSTLLDPDGVHLNRHVLVAAVVPLLRPRLQRALQGAIAVTFDTSIPAPGALVLSDGTLKLLVSSDERVYAGPRRRFNHVVICTDGRVAGVECDPQQHRHV